jgi:hypothetical protein
MKYILLVLPLCLAGSCLGQSDKEKITTEFVTLSLSGGAPAHYYRDGKKVIKLEVSAQGIGAPVTYSGPAVLSLYDDPAELAPQDPDKPKPEPSFQVALPADEDRILLIFSNAQGALPGVRALGISTAKMKAGDYRIFNLSRRNAYVVMNDEKAIIQPGKPADISSASWRSGTLDMEVRFGLREEEGLRQVYSSVWGHRASRRSFLFILDRDDEFNPFEIRRYHDVPTVQTTDSRE